MKQFLNFFALAMIFVSVGAFQSCEKSSKKEPVTTTNNGAVELSFQKIEHQLKKSGTVANPYAIVATIEDDKGTKIKEKVEMVLLKMGDEYITKALTLTPGTYKITEYYVIDNANVTIYATPNSGSKLSNWVNNPLPIDFTVDKDKVTKLAPEVIAVNNFTPEDFGYTTFRLNKIESFDFLIAVFTYQETVKSYDLTSAKMTISSEGVILHQSDLAALTNPIKLPDTKEKYDIKIEKGNFTTFELTITNEDLKKHTNDPMKVYLEAI